MRMPHLMLLVVLFLGFITLLAHKPQGENAYAEEAIFIRSKKVDTATAPFEDVLRLCHEQAQAEHIAEQDLGAFMERCAAERMVNEALAE
ncbi:MAG: hypothetical protein ACOCWR_01765 [Oceanidesulfovibrio sp.]